MNKTCHKCGHIRQDNDDSPAWSCPKCGEIYDSFDEEPQPLTAKPPKKMKVCPYCGEEILGVAIKCKHCGSDLTGDAVQSRPPGKPPSKKTELSLKNIIIGVVCIVVIFVSVPGIFNKSSEKGTESRPAQKPTSTQKARKPETEHEKRMRKQKNEARKRKSDALLMCQSALRPKVRFPSTIDYSLWSSRYQPELSGGGSRWLISFEAKNGIGAMLPYQANCEIKNGSAKIVSVTGR